ncbi:hypothetical protein LIER_24671 [Lithospermum erythrorhizon]|uniref:Btz domain-containing protein n=1 Tax=Lithospermum erythrorhizon TaxID=34254 RepID=A0AAV3R690_LITER
MSGKRHRCQQPSKESDDRINEGPKKHHHRHNSGQSARNFRRREPTDSREHHGERSSRTAEEDKVKHHKFSELQSEHNPRAKKWPAFRDQKMDAEAEITAANPPKPNNSQLPASESDKKYERECHNYRSWDRRERPTTGERGVANRKGKFLSTDRYGDDNGRDRFAARQGNRLGGGLMDKWKHDLFDESNRSPPPKSEEDQIAKVEALLAS